MILYHHDGPAVSRYCGHQKYQKQVAVEFSVF